MSDPSGHLARLLSNVTLTQPTQVGGSDQKGEQERVIDHEVQMLACATSMLGAEASQAQIVNQDANALLSCRVAALGSLFTKAAEITRISQALEIDTIEYIVSRIISFDGGIQDVRKLLQHFKSDMKVVIKDTCRGDEWDQNSMVKILEACYNQALSGDLHVDNYFAPLYETSLESPYDPDFESEAYYEHENRLQVDDGYAKAENMRQQRRSEERRRNERRTHRDWIRFWVQILHCCRDGPTLFWPYPDDGHVEALPDIPTYLFRAYDAASSGNSNDAVVASSASMYQEKTCRTDLLSLQPQERAKKLCGHLKKKCFGGTDHADNLMSWSSSLLFTIQYAIWRCTKGYRPASEIYICAVDTRRFPYGQFARDMWLLEQCHNSQEERANIQNEIRLRKIGYDNGEYLSQGLVMHRGRSAVTTLEHMIQSGLHELYPELDDPLGKEQWTNRVRALRTAWAEPRATSHNDLYIASQIATTCFRNLQSPELAICLLSFRNRELKEDLSLSTILLVANIKMISRITLTDTRAWGLEWLTNEPAEVQRSMRATRAVGLDGTGSFPSVITSSSVFVRASLENVYSSTSASD